MDLTELLAFVVKNNASDVHLSPGLPPLLRLHGDLRRIQLPPLEAKEVRGMLNDMMNDQQREFYEANLQCDFSFTVSNLARFRVHAFVQQHGAAAVLRMLPSKVPTLDELKCPKIFAEIADQPRGLVLVTGPAGSGRSTTLAAMLNYINETGSRHILTIEDPIEFVHESKRSLITQCEAGPHTLSASSALRSALRANPDVILAGDLGDPERMRLALACADAGRLVFGTLHTSSAPKTLDRVIDVFLPHERDLARAMFAETLRAVISQRLLRTKDGAGLVAAHEILIGTPAIRNLVRENKIAGMYGAMQQGRAYGMQTLDQHLRDLVQEGIVTMGEARSVAANKEAFAD